MTVLKYQDITGRIIGMAFEVHEFLGNGFQEKVYQRALAWELTEAPLVAQAKTAGSLLSISLSKVFILQEQGMLLRQACLVFTNK